MIPAIVRKLESSEEELRRLMTVAEEAAAQRQREWEEQQERWRREDDQRRVEQAQSESRKQLSDIMDRWATALAVQRFFSEARGTCRSGGRRTPRQTHTTLGLGEINARHI
ncbi:hypothetical protein [Tabrizicola soli]|uniref:Uncharacterized protein n=1 Tax=Tabrizicola soli TaxID=2185115 RepID=A0ABV7DZY6_9RHOB|nr:hypothetical protein [Tabrizicola soli]